MRRMTLLAFLLLSMLQAAHAQADGVVRVLAIGNSFSQDAVEQYLHQLAEAGGHQLIIGNMYIGGCSLEKHYGYMKSGEGAYAYRKIGLDGVKKEQTAVALETALTDEPWDYVSLQQNSGQSGLYDTYTPYLQELVDYVKQLAPTARLVWHQTWAYAQNSTHTDFKNYDNDQQKMYEAIVAAARQAATDYGFSLLIPSGTAIQNARTTYLGDNLNRDGYHLNIYYGRYTAACTWFESLFGQDVSTNSYVPDGVDHDQARAAKASAHAAVGQPDAVTDLSSIQETLSDEVVYVAPDSEAPADGDGSAADKALKFTTFCTTLNDYDKGTTFHLAAGTYVPDATIDISQACTLEGETGQTIISGDKNGNGQADAGDLSMLLNVTSNMNHPVIVRGIDFTGCYAASGAADKSYGAVYANNCRTLQMDHCRLYGNTSATQGGIALRAFASLVHLTDCQLTDNKSVSHGAAIRLSSDNTKGDVGYTTLERCLVARNEVTNHVGSAICVQHSKSLRIVNSTIAENKAGYGGAVYVNGKNDNYDNALYIIGSTICGNKASQKTLQLQMATGANLHITNSIVVGDSYDSSAAANAAIGVADAAANSTATVTTLETAGYNVAGPLKASNTPTWDSHDNVGAHNTYAAVFGSNSLTTDGVVRPTNGLSAGISPTLLAQTVTDWGLAESDVDFTVDQLGTLRTDGSLPGAYCGYTSAIQTPKSTPSASTPTETYNLQGQRASHHYRGVVIRQGQKYINTQTTYLN